MNNYWHLFSGLLMLILVACMPPANSIAATSPLPSTTPALWTDANFIVSGICFEAAFDASQQMFILRDREALIRFYDLADNSQLCQHPVERILFNFANNSILAGLWHVGKGCTASYDVLRLQRDDRAKTFMLDLRFVTEGDCEYELVRPYWISIENAADYEISITIE